MDVELVSHGGDQLLLWLRYVGGRYEPHSIKLCPWGSPTVPDAAPDAEDGCQEWHTPTDADF